MRIVLVVISVFMGLVLQACYLNAKMGSLTTTAGSSDPGKINPVNIQVSNTEIVLQEQDTDILYNSELVLTLNQTYSKPITVNLILTDIYAQDTVDYSIDALSFVIAPGEINKSIPVSIKGDLLGEGSETFKIKISLSESEVTLSENEVLVSILDNDPIVLQVASLYPNSGSNFLSYVKNVRAVPLTQLADEPCTYLATKKYDDCVDGGYHRKVIATGEHSCVNLSMDDNLGLFDWVCSSSADPVFFYSKDMKTGKGLKDILNTSSFKNNFVTLKKNSVSVASSAPAAWWGNTISQVSLNTVPGSARINLS